MEAPVGLIGDCRELPLWLLRRFVVDWIVQPLDVFYPVCVPRRTYSVSVCLRLVREDTRFSRSFSLVAGKEDVDAFRQQRLVAVAEVLDGKVPRFAHVGHLGTFVVHFGELHSLAFIRDVAHLEHDPASRPILCFQDDAETA